MKDITPNRGLRRNVVPLHSLRPQHQICPIFVLSVQVGHDNSSSGGGSEIILYGAECSSATGRQSRMECDLESSVSPFSGVPRG